MTAMETELILVPDAIEPYIGFKYLRWHENRLWSDWGDKPWPTKEPFEAECHGPRDFAWEAVSGIPRPKPVGELEECDPGPRVALPAGLSWSWEPQPVNHDPVHENCKCGIYAVDTPDACAGYGPNPDPVRRFYFRTGYAKPGERLLVELAMWGKVIPGTTGMRGQFAYPQKIHGSSDAAKAAAEAYGVPLGDEEPADDSTSNDHKTDGKEVDITVEHGGFLEWWARCEFKSELAATRRGAIRKMRKRLRKEQQKQDGKSLETVTIKV